MRFLPVLMFVCACGGAGTAEPSGPTIASGVTVDTFILMRHPAGGIHLVDPATGRAGPSEPTAYSAAVTSIDDDVAISPDHQRVAWVRATGTIAIADPRLVDGVPTLVIARELPDVTYQGLAWTPDGDRIVTTHMIIDPATGTTHACPDDDPTGSPVVLNETLVTFPGTRRYICPDGLALYDDGRYVGHAGQPFGVQLSRSPVLTADGQLYGTQYHQPSATTRPVSYVADPLWESGALQHFALPDGKVLVAPESADDGFVYDLPAIFASGVWQPTTSARWFLRDGLAQHLQGGDGALPIAIGLQDNGRELVFAVRTLAESECPPEYVDKCPEDTEWYDIDSAVVAIAPSGEARGGVLTSTLTDEGFIRLADHVYDLAGDDFLVPGWTPKDNGQEPHLVGIVGGEHVHYRGFDTLTPDGRWLYGLRRYTANPNEGGLHCFRERASSGGGTCFQQASQGAPIGFVGQGVKPEHAGSPPAITGLSRTGAWPGAPVVVFGAHFGTSGTLSIGKTPVTDIDHWSPNAIHFRMPDASGQVVVATEHGTSGHRDFHLGVSALIETRFSGMTTSEVSGGQGVNLVDLGEVELDGATGATFVPTGDGRHAWLGNGAAPARTVAVELHAGEDMRTLRVHEEDRSADATRWQLVAGVIPGADPRLEMIGDALVEVDAGLIPHMLGERLAIDTIEPRLFVGGAEERGMPDQWRNVEGGAWTISRFDGNPGSPRWSLRFLTGWADVQTFSRQPIYAPTPRYTFPYLTQGLAGHGEVVLATGLDPDLQGGGYLLSDDGGTSFTPFDAGTALPLREPIAITAGTPFFLVFEASYTSAGVSVHAIDLAGAFTPDVLPPLPDASLARAETVPTQHLQHATLGRKIALRFENTRTLHLADLDGAKTWTTVSGVQSIYQRGAELYAVMRDGRIQRSTDWVTFEPVDLGIDLALPTRVVPVALSELDGRWLVLAHLFDARPGVTALDTPSPLAPAALLLGPR